MRDEGVRYKLNPDRVWLDGAIVILVDDSIVRGTTIPKIIKMLRRAGAKEVHLRIGSPPIRFPCFMGVATPTREELVANRLGPEELHAFTTADSLRYLSLRGLTASAGPFTAREQCRFPLVVRRFTKAPHDSSRRKIADRLAVADSNRYCFACFTGDYPVPVPKKRKTVQ